MAIEWETPPEDTAPERGTKWRLILKQLREHPGEWARVAEDVSAAATAAGIRNGKLGGGEKGEFETRYKVLDPAQDKRLGTVWARYTPPPTPNPRQQ